SSRRRHTRCYRDWSSDVCSSDLKNRLARLAIASSRLEGLGTHLKGPTGVIFSKEDPVAVAKALHTFARANQALAIKAGYVEGQRSEERRVGKERRAEGAWSDYNN